MSTDARRPVEKETCNSDDFALLRKLDASVKRLLNKTKALEKEIQELKKENLELKKERDQFKDKAMEAAKESEAADEYIYELLVEYSPST